MLSAFSKSSTLENKYGKKNVISQIEKLSNDKQVSSSLVDNLVWWKLRLSLDCINSLLIVKMPSMLVAKMFDYLYGSCWAIRRQQLTTLCQKEIAQLHFDIPYLHENLKKYFLSYSKLNGIRPGD